MAPIMGLYPEQRKQMVDQLGRMNIMSISGGRIRPIENGVELPVSNGYLVRVELTPMDTYTVSRIFKRGGKEWIKGKPLEDVYCDEVGEMAYRAGMFRSFTDKGWPSGERG